MENSSNVQNLFQECLGDKQYKIRKFTVDFKLKVIKLIESNVSLHVISDKLKIDRKVLRDWRDKKQSLMEVRNKNKKFRCNRNNGEKKIFPMGKKK